MNGVFPRYSMSTPLFTKALPDMNCRVSFEDDCSQTSSPTIISNNSNSSASNEYKHDNKSNSRTVVRRHSNYSATPHQRIHRKPVPSLNVTLQPTKDYEIADTPSEITAYSQASPVHQPVQHMIEKRQRRQFQDLNIIRPIEKKTTVDANMPTSTLIPTFWYPRTGKENVGFRLCSNWPVISRII